MEDIKWVDNVINEYKNSKEKLILYNFINRFK